MLHLPSWSTSEAVFESTDETSPWMTPPCLRVTVTVKPTNAAMVEDGGCEGYGLIPKIWWWMVLQKLLTLPKKKMMK